MIRLKMYTNANWSGGEREGGGMGKIARGIVSHARPLLAS